MKTLIAIVLGIVTCTVIGVYIYVSTQLDTKELRLIVLQKIEKNFPHLEANIGEISLELGQSIELKSNTIEVSTKDKDPLLTVKDVTIKVPIFSIILGGGNIEVDISSPNFFYHMGKKQTNWDKALKDNTAAELFRFEKAQELIIPAFMANSTLALRLHDSQFIHKDEKEVTKKTSISKLVIKNLGLNSNAAYELKSNFNYLLKNGDRLSFHSFIVGSINFSEYLTNKNLPIKASYKFDEISINGFGEVLPMINGSIDAEIDKEGITNLTNTLRIDKSNIKHQVKINNKELYLSALNAKVFLSDLNAVFSYLKFPMKINEGELLVTGELTAKKEGYFPKINVLVKELKGVLPGTEYKASGELAIATGVAKLMGRANLYDGSITVDSNLNFIAHEDLALDKKVKSLKTSFTLADMKLTSGSLSQIFISNSNKKEEDHVLWPVFFVIPNSEVTAEIVNSKLDQKKLTLDLAIKTNKKKAKVNNFKINFDRGILDVAGDVNLYEDGINSKWNIKAKNFSSQVFRSFIDKENPFLVGEFNGGVRGPYSVKSGQSIYDFKFSLESKKGVLTGINLNEEFNNFKKEIATIPLVGSEIKWKNTKLSNDYVDVKFEGVLKDQNFKIEKFKYMAQAKSMSIDAKGNIALDEDEPSKLTGTFKDDLGLSDYMKAKFAMKTIPFAVTGKGTHLSLDQDYTRNKFLEHLKGKEGKAKVEKAIDENVDKYIKGDSGKQLKKLIKGFLK